MRWKVGFAHAGDPKEHRLHVPSAGQSEAPCLHAGAMMGEVQGMVLRAGGICRAAGYGSSLHAHVLRPDTCTCADPRCSGPTSSHTFVLKVQKCFYCINPDDSLRSMAARFSSGGAHLPAPHWSLIWSINHGLEVAKRSGPLLPQPPAPHH